MILPPEMTNLSVLLPQGVPTATATHEPSKLPPPPLSPPLRRDARRGSSDSGLARRAGFEGSTARGAWRVPDSDKWGMSWNHASRRAAIDDARSKCGANKCPMELSFYGSRCGAFAISDASWSLIQRDTVQLARKAALDECGKAGKSCRIIGAVCADGSGR